MSTQDLATIERQFEFEQRKFEVEQRKAKAYASSLMMPAHLRDIGSMMIINQMSTDLKIPMLLLAQNIFMVKGKIGMSAQLVIALINASGIYDHDLQFEERQNPFGVRAFAEKDGVRVDGIWIDDQMIQANGWNSNQNWKTLKPLMARYRSASYFARLNCPMVLMGFHTDEEIIDTTLATPEEDTVPTGEKTLNMAVAKKPEPEVQTLTHKDEDATEAILELHDPISGEVEGHDLRDIKEEEIYPSKEEAERDHPLIVDGPTELDTLKMQADNMGIKYRSDIQVDTLRKKVEAGQAEMARLMGMSDEDIDKEIATELEAE